MAWLKTADNCQRGIEMAAFSFFMPPVNHMGEGCLDAAMNDIVSFGLTKALVVTDKVLNEIGLVADVVEQLGAKGIASVIFDGTQPNPTCGNVAEGLKLLEENQCDCVISLGWWFSSRLRQGYCSGCCQRWRNQRLRRC